MFVNLHILILHIHRMRKTIHGLATCSYASTLTNLTKHDKKKKKQGKPNIFIT